MFNLYPININQVSEMTYANPTLDYATELSDLRSLYVSVHPQSRLNVIRQRLAKSEIGPTRLVTIVSAVEALARSLAVHASVKQGLEIASVYDSYRYEKPEALVKEVLNRYGDIEPQTYFKEDTWSLFLSAVGFRNLIVHECTYLGQDKYPSLIQASEDILTSLIILGGLREVEP